MTQPSIKAHRKRNQEVRMILRWCRKKISECDKAGEAVLGAEWQRCYRNAANKLRKEMKETP